MIYKYMYIVVLYNSHQCNMPCFVKISPLVPQKTFFDGFYHICHDVHGDHLGHVTWIIFIYALVPIPIDSSYQVWL